MPPRFTRARCRPALASAIARRCRRAGCLAQAPPLRRDPQKRGDRADRPGLPPRRTRSLQEAMAELEKRPAGGAEVGAEQRRCRRSARQPLLNRRTASSSATRPATSPWSSSSTTIAATANARSADLRTLMKSDPKLRVVLKDFPVLGPEFGRGEPRRARRQAAAQGRQAVRLPRQVMETRGRVNGERAIASPRRWASTWPACRRTWRHAEVKAALQENVALGDKLGLTGTPAFIVGEEIISGAVGARPAEAGRRQRPPVRQGDLLSERPASERPGAASSRRDPFG